MMNNTFFNKPSFPEVIPFWGVGIGPKEYGIYKLSRPRKKLKGWQKQMKRKRK